MTASLAPIESEVTELAVDAFDAFCQDISGMFGVEMNGEHKEITLETVATLKKRFKKLTAVNTVRSEGVMDGMFQLLFDQGGLFTLSGVIVMLPENRIMEEIKRGTVEDLGSMNDAIGEVGNLLVGSWDRVFREDMEGHGHFLQTGSFIGKPWDNPEEKISLSSKEELICVGFEVTVDPYPSFACAAVFPRSLFGTKEAPAEPVEETPAEPVKPEPAPAPKPVAPEPAEPPQAAAPAEAPQEIAPEPEVVPEPVPEPAEVVGQEVEPKAEEPPVESKVEEVVESGPAAVSDSADNDGTDTEEVESAPVETVESQTVHHEPPANAMVSEAIQRMTRSDGRASSDSAIEALRARDIMQDKLIWVGPDDSVQQVHGKMQQHTVDYVLVGNESALEGIVSSSTIAGAMSPYLRPIFQKWRRPLDDATLQIKIKWVMSRPVQAVGIDVSVREVARKMQHHHVRSLCVVDEQGRTVGIITAFDMMRWLCGDGVVVQATRN